MSKSPGHDDAAPIRRRRLRKLLRLAGILAAVPLAAWLIFQAAVAWWPYPKALDLPPAAGTWIEDRHGTPLAAFVADDDQWRLPLTADQISPHLLHAIVAVEDARFFDHHGVDWKAVAAAGWEDLSSLRVRRGASTLTMQVQRLRDPQPRTLFVKIGEAIRACQLEERFTKQQLLVEYINRAPFGGNLVGAGAASWRYFGRPCRDLSLGQAALLAGLPKSPNRYRPDRFPQRAIARRDHVLDRMLACGIITPRQYAQAKAEPVDARWRPLPQDAQASAESPTQPARGNGALPMLARLARQYPGRQLLTSLDAAIQAQAARAGWQELDHLQSSGVTAAAIVVLDTQTAQCLASVSLARNDSRSVDLVRSPRSTGSVLKPLIYAAAFDAGICTPSSILPDTPAAWPGYTPSNFDREFRGTMTAAEALAESRNIPAMLVLAKVGVQRTVGILQGAGLRRLARNPQRYGVSLAIGGAEASALEVAEAYATLGRGGRHIPATFLLQASPADAANAKPVAILRDEACWQALGAISNSDRTADSCPEAAPLGVAWKTGTSSGFRDAWCAAVTPRRTVVVWLGNPMGQGSHILVGKEAVPLALRLIASIDKGGSSWPQTRETTAAKPQPFAPLGIVAASRHHAPMRANPAAAGLTIASPADGQEIVLNPDIPATRQRVLLSARAGSAILADDKHPTLWWFIDSQPLATTDAQERTWWDPAPGLHEIRVMDAAGHSALARVRVR